MRTIIRNGKRLACTAVLLGLLPNGCASMSDTDKGVVGGGTAGAVAGGIAGHALGNTGAGVVLGALGGGLIGGLIGNHSDEKKAEAAAAAAQARWLSKYDIVQMVQQHVSDAVIINQIRATGSIYRLTSDDIVMLKSNGVSDLVLGEMQNTAWRPRRYYVEQPVYVEPAPVAVGIGVSGRFR